jgi:hypothetical protein
MAAWSIRSREPCDGLLRDKHAAHRDELTHLRAARLPLPAVVDVDHVHVVFKHHVSAGNPGRAVCTASPSVACADVRR